MDQSSPSMVVCCVNLWQGFTCVLYMTQVLLREVWLRRKAVLLYPEGFAQVALVGFFSLRNFVDPCIRWESMCSCLYHPFSGVTWMSHLREFSPFSWIRSTPLEGIPGHDICPCLLGGFDPLRRWDRFLSVVCVPCTISPRLFSN